MRRHETCRVTAVIDAVGDKWYTARKVELLAAW